MAFIKNPNSHYLSFFFPAIKDESKKVHYREKINGYMDRAEQIKVHLNKVKEGKNADACWKSLRIEIVVVKMYM